MPHQELPTADGHMILAVGNDARHARLCHVAAKRQWASHERFITNPQRVAHRAVLIPVLREVTCGRSTVQSIESPETTRVLCGPINRIDEVLARPQIRAAGRRRGRRAAGGHPTRFSATPVEYRRAPPRPGEHTQEVIDDGLRGALAFTAPR